MKKLKRPKNKITTFREIHERWMKDPEFKKAYDAGKNERALYYAIISRRMEKGLTQRELAEKTGLKQSAIARFETGTSNPTLSFLNKLATALGVEIVVKA